MASDPDYDPLEVLRRVRVALTVPAFSRKTMQLRHELALSYISGCLAYWAEVERGRSLARSETECYQCHEEVTSETGYKHIRYGWVHHTCMEASDSRDEVSRGSYG